MTASKSSSNNIVIRNKRALHRFVILDEFECGIILTGPEVKSIRQGQTTLDESYARVEGNEIWLIGMHIKPYEHASAVGTDPTRSRKLLLHRHQITKILTTVTQKGLTLIPLSLQFNERGIIKVTLSIAKGKQTHDKRQSLKEREHRREMDRAMRKR